MTDEAPQQSRFIAASLWDVSGSPESSLTISFIKKESFKPSLKKSGCSILDQLEAFQRICGTAQ